MHGTEELKFKIDLIKMNLVMLGYNELWIVYKYKLPIFSIY